MAGRLVRHQAEAVIVQRKAMFSPRWRKVLRDLWGNRRRTLLVVLSIAVGVFAVGTVAHMQRRALHQRTL